MNNQTFSVTFYQEGAVRLVRPVKKSKGGEMINQSKTKPAFRTLTFTPNQYNSLPSRTELKQTWGYKKDYEKVYSALKDHDKVRMHCNDIANDLGGVLYFTID